MDNKGHPMIKTVGMVAGDEESYAKFGALFDPVITMRHGGYAPDAVHPTDMDCSKLSDTPIDPKGKHVISTRVCTGSSIRGLRLPPCCDLQARREVKRVFSTTVLSFQAELKGEYWPLAGSQSYEANKGGMTRDGERELREAHFLFQEPDSPRLLSSGMGRNWPDARGIFANDEKNFFVWVNEEDHT
jgi:creatine kinase